MLPRYRLIAWIAVLAAAWLWFATHAAVAAPPGATPPTDCSSPRHAVMMVFDWQQPEQLNEALAAQCLEATGRSGEELRRLAMAIKEVFDERALYVRADEFSLDGDFRDPRTGEHVVRPHPSLPNVVVLRMPDGRWLWTTESLDVIEGLYSVSLSRRIADNLPPWLRGKALGVEMWQYLALLLIVLVGLILRKVIQYVVSTRIRGWASTLGKPFAESLIAVFASPGATLIMGILCWALYPMLGLPIRAAIVMDVAVRMLIILSVVWAVYAVVDVLAEWMAAKAAATHTKLDDQLVPLVRKSLKVLTVIGGVLFGLQNLDVNVLSLLAGLGIGGIAFALAAKDTVSNFFGSFLIFTDRPFQIGDWIAVADAEGVVEEVGFRTTRIRSFDNAIVIVPNARFTDQNVRNFGMRKYRRCRFTLGLTYDTPPDQIQAFCEGVRAILMANSKTRKDYYEVHLSEFGAHSLDVLVYFFFEVDSWSAELEGRHEVSLAILHLARSLGLSFAFPTRTLHMFSHAESTPAAIADEELARRVREFGPRGALRAAGTKRLTHGYLPGSDAHGGDAG